MDFEDVKMTAWNEIFEETSSVLEVSKDRREKELKERIDHIRYLNKQLIGKVNPLDTETYDIIERYDNLQVLLQLHLEMTYQLFDIYTTKDSTDELIREFGREVYEQFELLDSLTSVVLEKE